MQDICKNESASMQKITEILSHDIKTPIIAQMRSLELVLDGVFGDINAEQREIILQTYESSKFLYKMICELLMCCRYENGETRNIFQKFDFCALVRECIVKNASHTAQKGINIKFISRINSGIIQADKDSMEIAVINLIYDAICRAHNDCEIRIVLQEGKNALTLGVNYECKNMSEEILNQLFEKSLSGIAKYNTIGTDINLSLCKKIAEAHGGSVFSSFAGDNINYGFMVPFCKENF